ncbi:MAG: FadR/GntR family transcriptional regulator [Sphaerochaetaceae bacterium]|nr:FadR/GntR family transcriptional regulator [Sphaerochaetaceae bacterium]
MAAIQKIKRITLTDQIVNQLQNLIDSKEFEVGEKLPSEGELCNLFGASRSTVREALRVLSATGLVEIRSGVGAFVASPKDTSFQTVQKWFADKEIELEELIELRIAIETLAVKLTIQKADDLSIQLIRDINEEFKAACDVPDNTIHLATLDDSFHSAIVEASGNRLLIKVGKLVSEQMIDFRLRSFSISENVDHAKVAHEKIISAICDRDVAKGMNTMTEHLELTKEDMKQVIGH